MKFEGSITTHTEILNQEKDTAAKLEEYRLLVLSVITDEGDTEFLRKAQKEAKNGGHPIIKQAFKNILQK